jgi:hypothetical protein
MKTTTSEAALSVVLNHATNEIIDERDELRAENERLKVENRFLYGFNDHGYGAEDGRFIIASYRREQRFHIPKEAVAFQIKWGVLHWRDANGKEHEEPPFNGGDLEQEDWKRPDAIRYTDEDEDDLYQQYMDELNSDDEEEDEEDDEEEDDEEDDEGEQGEEGEAEE